MNQTIISGHLTADIETREIKAREKANGVQHLSKFTLACNDGERVVFMPVEAWNMPHLAEHLFKGSKALLAGSLKQEHWETDAGDKRSRIVLTAHKVDFLDPAPSRESHSHPERGPQRGPQRGQDTRRTRSQSRPSRSAA